MKKIYYAIVEEIEVDENLSEQDIDKLLQEKAKDRNFCWSNENDLFDYDYY